MEFVEASKETSDSNFQFDRYRQVEKILPVLGFLLSNFQNDKKARHNMQKITKFLSTSVFSSLKTCYGDRELLFFIRKIVVISSNLDLWFDMKNMNEIHMGSKILIAAALILFFLNWDSLSKKLIIPMDIVMLCKALLNSLYYKLQSDFSSLFKEYSCIRKTEYTDGNCFKKTLEWTDAETRACFRKLTYELYHVFEKPVIFYPRTKIDTDSSFNIKPKVINDSPTTVFIEEVKVLVESKSYPHFCHLVSGAVSKISSRRQQFPYDMKKESALEDYHFKWNYKYNRKQTVEKPKVLTEFEDLGAIYTSSKLRQRHESDSGYDTEPSSPEKKPALDVKIGSEALSEHFIETELSPEILEFIESDLPPWLQECQCGDENCSDCLDKMACKNFLIGMKSAYPKNYQKRHSAKN